MFGGVALGPLFARASAESSLQDALRSDPAATTLTFSYSDALTDAPQVTMGRFEQLSRGIATGVRVPGYGGPITELVDSALVQSASGDTPAAWAPMTYRSGQCEHLRIVAGRCPVRVGEALISARTASPQNFFDWRLGTVLASGSENLGSLKVVGLYQPVDAGGAYWSMRPYFVQDDGSPQTPPTVDSIFVTEAQFRAHATSSAITATTSLLLAPAKVDLAAETALVARVRALQQRYPAARATSLSTGLIGVLERAGRQRASANVGFGLVTGQLALVGWVVLFGIFRESMEARGAEIAIGKLRGLRPGRLLRFALGENVVLLLAALPFGLALGFGGAAWLSAATLRAGTPLHVDLSTPSAVVLALLGAAAALAGAGRSVLRRSVIDQWRRTRSPERPPAYRWVIDAAVAVAALAGFVLLKLDATAAPFLVAAPALLILAVGLVGSRLVPLALRAGFPATRASRRVALYLGIRQLARRPTGPRLVALLTVSVGLAAFAAGAAGTAATNRSGRAKVELGAAAVATVVPDPGVDPVRAIERMDPDGRWAMAAATWLPTGGESLSGSTLLAVDASRWPSIGAHTAGVVSPSELAPVIAHGTADVVPVTASRLAVTIDAQDLTAGAIPRVVLVLDDHLGREIDADAGTLQAGRHTYSASVACTAGCELQQILFRRPLGAADRMAGTVLVADVLESLHSTTRPVDALLSTAGAWRAAPPVSLATDQLQAESTGLRDRYESTGGGYGGIAVTTYPDPLPAVATPGAVVSPAPTGGYAVGTGDVGETASFAVARTAAVLPHVLDHGLLLDARFLEASVPQFVADASWQVWMSDGAPADAADRIAKAGFTVESVQTVGDRVAVLGRQAPALALTLLLVAALLDVVLATAGTVSAIAAAARRRTFETAALKAIGVPARTLSRAALVEIGTLLALAVVLGTPMGYLSALLLLPELPESSTRTPVPLQVLPAIGPVLAVGAAVLIAVLLAAVVVTRLLLRASTAARLRGGEE